MAERIGRDTQWTSHQIKKIYQELKSGNKQYAPNAKLCDAPGCRAGFKINNITGETEECPRCSGWGVIRII